MAGKMPRAIKLGAAVYKVESRKNMTMLGETLHNDTVIQVRTNQSDSARRDTLLHEVLHAVTWTSGAQHALGIDDNDDERLVRVMTPWLLGVLRDNPELVTFLTEV